MQPSSLTLDAKRARRVPHVLVACGTKATRAPIVDALRAHGRIVSEVETPHEAIEIASRCDLILLEVASSDAWKLAREVLDAYPTMPLVILGEAGSVEEEIRAFDVGAEDYVCRRTDPAVIAARVTAALRRRRHGEVLRFGEITIDLGHRTAYRFDERLRLTALEFDLLVTLATHPMRVWSRCELLRSVWSESTEAMERTVDVRIRHLRKALGDDVSTPTYIETVRGRGYRWTCPPADRT